MRTLIKRRDLLMCAGAPLLALPGWAQDSYPSKTVKIVVPVPPGASTDALARHLAQRLGAKWNQTVIVENRAGGAGGNVGAEAVANAEPDGYTLLFAAAGPLAINKVLYPKLGYDPSRWSRISLVATIENALVVRPDAPFKTVAELIMSPRAIPASLTTPRAAPARPRTSPANCSSRCQAHSSPTCRTAAARRR